MLTFELPALYLAISRYQKASSSTMITVSRILGKQSKNPWASPFRRFHHPNKDPLKKKGLLPKKRKKNSFSLQIFSSIVLPNAFNAVFCVCRWVSYSYEERKCYFKFYWSQFHQQKCKDTNIWPHSFLPSFELKFYS